LSGNWLLPRKKSTDVTPLKTDWSMNIGNKARVGAGQYPATFTFATTTPSCNDYAAYNTGVAGVSGGQANILAYKNLYEGTCTPTVPTINFAYYSGSGSLPTSSRRRLSRDACRASPTFPHPLLVSIDPSLRSSLPQTIACPLAPIVVQFLGGNGLCNRPTLSNSMTDIFSWPALARALV
jgi:hypothetical protein